MVDDIPLSRRRSTLVLVLAWVSTAALVGYAAARESGGEASPLESSAVDSVTSSLPSTTTTVETTTTTVPPTTVPPTTVPPITTTSPPTTMEPVTDDELLDQTTILLATPALNVDRPANDSTANFPPATRAGTATPSPLVGSYSVGTVLRAL